MQETENIVFDGAKAAVARIHLNQAADAGVLERIRMSTDDIIEVAVLGALIDGHRRKEERESHD